MRRPVPSLDDVRGGGKPVMARALGLIETAEGDDDLIRLLDDAALDPRGDVLGVTGPPGVGKSTLTNVLIARARAEGRTVAVVAIDPSSQRSGGALLGDRTRLKTDPDDTGIFVRSMAARDRLGGLSDHAIATIVLMRAVYDLVIVESVGVGQSEGDVAHVADTLLLLVQPGSGDSLQFMKAGIMELPDLIAVTKADVGPAAMRAVADLEGALTLQAHGHRPTRVLAVSAIDGAGLDELASAIIECAAGARDTGLWRDRRGAQARIWFADAIRRRFGSEGLAALGTRIGPEGLERPFSAIAATTLMLRQRLSLT
jgi:LAO/AO transport system kinase